MSQMLTLPPVTSCDNFSILAKASVAVDDLKFSFYYVKRVGNAVYLEEAINFIEDV